VSYCTWLAAIASFCAWFKRADASLSGASGRQKEASSCYLLALLPSYSPGTPSSNLVSAVRSHYPYLYSLFPSPFCLKYASVFRNYSRTALVHPITVRFPLLSSSTVPESLQTYGLSYYPSESLYPLMHSDSSS
jgi:hypothetical protein